MQPLHLRLEARPQDEMASDNLVHRDLGVVPPAL